MNQAIRDRILAAYMKRGQLTHSQLWAMCRPPVSEWDDPDQEWATRYIVQSAQHTDFCQEVQRMINESVLTVVVVSYGSGCSGPELRYGGDWLREIRKKSESRTKRKRAVGRSIVVHD